MNGIPGPTLLETLEYLMTLGREGARPEEARARLRLLQRRHPGTGLDLVWEEEAYDGSVHYDALLDAAGGGTVSLSFCPDRGLPWPMRGVQRWSESDLVRVNTTVLKVGQAIACLDFLRDDAEMVRRLVDTCLVQEALERDPIDLPDAELQRALDGFRRARGLLSAEATRRWMERRGLSHAQLEQLVADEALVAKLRDQVAAGRIEGYFETHRADFEAACIARVEFPDEEDARRALEPLRAGAVDFDELARRRFLAAAEDPGHAPRDLFAVVRRGHGDPALAAAVFAAAPGDVVGPLPRGDGSCLVLVLSIRPARLDEPTRAAIERALFEEWLEERRRVARIEWFWGRADRTQLHHPTEPPAD